MKLSCLQENLSHGLGLIQHAVGVRTPLPITQNVLLATDEGRLKLVATNLEMAITCWIGAKIEEEGTITVPAKLLSEFVGSLPAERIDLSVSARTRALQLKCLRQEARISGMDAKDFPPIPAIEDGITVKVEAEALRNAINQVVFAAATDESRPVLTGVDARFEDSQVTLAAADGFRLAVCKLPAAEPVKDKIEVIIPAKTLAEVNRLSADQDEPIEMLVNSTKSQALFRIKNLELVTQLVQGTFPVYTQLIPQSFSTRMVVPVAAFLSATKTAAIFARDGSGIVRLVVTPGGEMGAGKLTIAARSEENENVGELDAKVEGQEAKIAFNGKYLSDVLSVLKTQEVALEATNPSSPGVIRPVGSDDYVHVVMPMFVQW